MSLVYMPFPVSWFHSLSALLSVLLKRILLKEISNRRAEPAFCAPQPFIMWAQADERAPSQARLWLVLVSPRSEVSPWSEVAGRSWPVVGKLGGHGTHWH